MNSLELRSWRIAQRWISETQPSSSSEARSRTTETAEAPTRLLDSTWLRMKTEVTVVSGSPPAKSRTEPNSPSARAKASAIPAPRPGRRLGKMMRRKIVKLPAPSEAAAASISRSISSSSGCTARTTKGRVTNISATTTAARVDARSIPSGLSLP